MDQDRKDPGQLIYTDQYQKPVSDKPENLESRN